jgi:hypothetical protein
VPAIAGLRWAWLLLGTVEDWTSGVPFEAAVERIDPTRSNPYVQANAGGFHADVVQITAEEYDIVTTSSCRCGTGREASLSNRSCDSNSARRARLNRPGIPGGANFIGASFVGAYLGDTNLVGASFAYANLTNANLVGAKISNTDFFGAIWRNTICPDGSNSDRNPNCGF